MSALQFKTFDKSSSFTKEDIWAGDCAGREETARKLCSLIAGQERPLTICLNGAWGTGKTYFLTRFNSLYNSREHVGRSVYFNAWEDDFLDDPLIAIISRLRVIAPDKASVSLFESIKSAAVPCLMKSGLAVSKAILKNLGIDVDAIDADDLKSATELAFDQYEEMSLSRNVLRTKLSEFAEHVWKQTNKPLLFIIDELDRCRPTFAIELLERIKHLFSVPHLVFVIGADVSQLQKSIKVVYGDIDVNDYLHRFFDLEVMLPPVEMRSFVFGLWEELGLENYGKSHGIGLDYQSTTIDEFMNLIKYRNLTLRQIEKIVRNYALLMSSSHTGYCEFSQLAAIAVVLSVIDRDLFERFINFRCNLGELLNSLYPNMSYNELNSQESLFSVARYLTRIMYYADDRWISHSYLADVKKRLDDKKQITYHPECMPECFSSCSNEELSDFYGYVFAEDRQRHLYGFKKLKTLLASMGDTIRMIGR